MADTNKAGPASRIPGIISVDDHVIEPRHVWTSWLPERYRDKGPRIERHRVGGLRYVGGAKGFDLEVDPADGSGTPTDLWVYDDRVFPHKRPTAAAGIPRDELSLATITYEEMRPGCYEVKSRLGDMDLAGIDKSLSFPTFPRFCGQQFLEAKDRELALECVYAYNRWMIEEWCGESNGRLVPLIIIPLWDPTLAAAEVRRAATQGCHAVCFSEIPSRLGLPSIHSGEWEPFFAACAETNTVICMHIGSSSQMPETSADAPPAVAGVLTFHNASGALTDWLLSGIFDRHPTLKVAFSEAQIGWIPYILERIDDAWAQHGAWTGLRATHDRSPSHYYYSNVFSCFFRDKHGIDSLDAVGEDNITFECDYPHADSSWPDTHHVAEELLGHLTDEQIYKIVRGNAIRMLSLQED